MKHRMSESAYQLAMKIGNDDFSSEMQSIAESEKACVVLYRIEDNTLVMLDDYKESPDCVIHQTGSGALQHVLEGALAEDGVYQIRWSDFRKNVGDTQVIKPKNDRLISALVVRNGTGQYLLVWDAAVFPEASAVSTLRFQLVAISLGLFLISALFSFFLASYISRPIERITKKSKGLSRGKYELDNRQRSYREIEELSETLSQAADEISKVDRLQKELIANISHDLRTPLTMIIGYAEVMRDIEGENTPENMQVVIDEATRLSVLVNDLLEISRLQGGNVERKDEIFDLSREVENTMERYKRLKENAGFVFETQIESGVMVKADKGKLLQVIYNLIGNAINYSEDDKRIAVRLRVENGIMRFEVEDHGIGIPAEDLQNIWQRYYKVDKQHRRSAMGSGLGLSIVHDMLELHGARYGVQSECGVGSTFWFELPVYLETENALLLD